MMEVFESFLTHCMWVSEERRQETLQGLDKPEELETTKTGKAGAELSGEGRSSA